MELTESQYQRIADCLPRQRSNVRMTNLRRLTALLYVTEQGFKGRGVPKHCGNGHTLYTRMNRGSKAGVVDRIFTRLQQEQILAVRMEGVFLDSTLIKGHPDGPGALKKWAASHRAFAGRLPPHDSFGCREGSMRLEPGMVSRPSGGCAPGT